MPAQHNGTNNQQEERTKQQERAERILNAAAELIERWGYNKTTIDDIARQAHVAKGTIYLHWKTKEELFRALIYHEQMKMMDDIKQRIASDPQGATLHGYIKHGMLATMKRPLWKAMLLRDSDMLGEFSRRSLSETLNAERLASFITYFEFLRDQGLIRTDLGLREQVYMLNAISIGFLLIDPFLPDEFKLSDEEAADMLADTIQRTFEPRQPVHGHESQEASSAFHQYFDHVSEIIKEQDQQEMGT